MYPTNGERIGRTEHAHLHPQTQAASLGHRHDGLFDNHESFVPLTKAFVSSNRISVPFSKEHIRDSPTVVPVDMHLTPDDELSLNIHYRLNYLS